MPTSLILHSGLHADPSHVLILPFRNSVPPSLVVILIDLGDLIDRVNLNHETDVAHKVLPIRFDRYLAVWADDIVLAAAYPDCFDYYTGRSVVNLLEEVRPLILLETESSEKGTAHLHACFEWLVAVVKCFS